MNSVINNIVSKLNNVKIQENKAKATKSFDMEKLANKFYFENLTDDAFFTKNEAKDGLVDFYSKIAKSGVETVILGGVWVGLKHNKSLARLYSNNNIMKTFNDVVKVIHRNNSKAYLRIIPAFGREVSGNNLLDIFRVSTGFKRDIFDSRISTLRISDGKIYDLIDEVTRVAELAEVLGFDGIMIDATMSNIFGELSSKETNNRMFGYFQNHLDLLYKMIKEINKKRKSIKLFVKISAFSMIYSAFSAKNQIATTKRFNQKIDLNSRLDDLKRLAKLGVNGFEFSFGLYENEFLRTLNQFIKEDVFDEFYKQVSSYLKAECDDILILYNNPYYSINNVKELIENGVVDLINVTKNLLADVEYVNKIKQNQTPNQCIHCNYCDETQKHYNFVKCAVNPGLYESDINITKTKPKNVAVIGAGVSGLVCTITLLSRKNKVVLFDSNLILNKNGKICDIYNFDEFLNKYFLSLEKQLSKYKNSGELTINLNTNVTSDNLNYNKFDAVVVATGFKQKCLLTSGAVYSHVKSIYDVLENKDKLKNVKDIVLNIKTELSLKLALYLSINNYRVSLLVSNIEILKSINHSNLTYYLYQFQRLGVKVFLDCYIKKINEDNIDLFANKYFLGDYVSHIYNYLSNQNFKSCLVAKCIDCDLFIYEPEIVPNNKLYYDIVKSGYKGEVYLVGQALEGGDLANDIESGYYVGKNIWFTLDIIFLMGYNHIR